MNLCQLEGTLDNHFADELSALLEEDVLSFSWQGDEPGDWTFQILCSPDKETKLKEKVEAYFALQEWDVPVLKATLLQDKDWVSAVYKDLPPLRLGQFYIYGSHIQEAPPPSLVPLCIDAATAFGSGQHESTEGCLRALSWLAAEWSFSHPLDMGCGSGILALAMASLWKAPVVACDNDPEAVKVTQENARINHLEAYVSSFVSDGFEGLQGKKFDLITANILAGPLCAMARDAVTTLDKDGMIVLSGLLNRQAEDVIDAYRSQGAKLVNQLFLGDWSTLIMRKESHG